MKIPRQIDMDRDEDTKKVFCRNYCLGIADAEKSKRNLMTMGYSEVMAERVVNQWAEILDRPLPFSVMIIRGSLV